MPLFTQDSAGDDIFQVLRQFIQTFGQIILAFLPGGKTIGSNQRHKAAVNSFKDFIELTWLV